METTNELKINKIFLMMGPACNFHCKYCLQVPIKNNDQDKAVSPDLYAYLDHLIKINADQQKSIRVVFWGGEPLLYWNVIKEFVLYYKNKLNYGIISNGSLLTQEKVDFINKYGIGFTLSHDGPNTDKTRNVDVLKNETMLALIQQLYPALNAVISGYNADYNALFNYWQQQYPNMPGHVEMLRITWDMPEDLRNIDLTVYRNGLKNFFADTVQNITIGKWNSKTSAAINIMRRVCQSIKRQRYHFPKCHQVEHVLNVDLDGNLYACHNSNVKIGHVNDARADYLERYWQWLETRKKPECDTCEIRHYCQGGCPLDITNEECALQKILYEEAVASYEQHKEVWDLYIGK